MQWKVGNTPLKIENGEKVFVQLKCCVQQNSCNLIQKGSSISKKILHLILIIHFESSILLLIENRGKVSLQLKSCIQQNRAYSQENSWNLNVKVA